MDTHQITCALLVVLAGGCLQGMAAFGFGLFAVPLLLALQLPAPMVMAIVAISSMMQSASGVHYLRNAVPWRYVGMSVAIRAPAMLLGIWVLALMANQPLFRLKFWVGLVVLGFVLLQAFWRPAPRPRLHNGWNLAAFLASGFTNGLCSMGGPPLVLWVMAHDWTAAQTRAFLFASFMALVPVQLAVLYWTFGNTVISGIAWGAAFSPVVLLGSLLGLRIGSRFSKPILSKLAFLLLVAIALSAMFPGMKQNLAKILELALK